MNMDIGYMNKQLGNMQVFYLEIDNLFLATWGALLWTDDLIHF